MRLAAALFLSLTVAASAAIDPVLLNLVSPDTKILSGMQIEQSKSSRFGQYVLAQMHSEDPDFRQWITDSGFDPRRDLKEILVASLGENNNLILGRGSFQPQRIVAAARTAGKAKGTMLSYQSFDILRFEDKGSDWSLAFPDSSLAVMGNLAAVKSTLDRYRGGMRLSGDLAAKAVAAAGANHAWFVSLAPLSDFVAGKPMDSNLSGSNLFDAVLQASGGVSFTSNGVRLSGEALARSDKDATALSDVVKFLAGIIQLQRGNSAKGTRPATLADTLVTSTNGNLMKLSLVIPESIVEQLFMPEGGAKQ